MIAIKASKVQMAAGISKAGIRVIRNKLHREGSLVTDDKWVDRLEICAECPLFREDGRCAECGCRMRLKSKFKFAECPIGKWKREI
jgi:hypothetical protein